jgi:hypothetical protein
MGIGPGALHTSAAELLAEDRTARELRQALQVYHVAIGAESVHLEVLHAWTGFVAGAASAAATEGQVCSAAPAEPVVSYLVVLAPALVQCVALPETSSSGRRVEMEEALVGLVLAPSVAVADYLAASVVHTCH